SHNRASTTPSAATACLYIFCERQGRSPISTLFPYTTLFRSGKSKCLSGTGLCLDPPRTGEKRSEPDIALERISGQLLQCRACPIDRKSTRLNSSHVSISYAVFCLKKKKNSNRIQSLCYHEIA